MVRDHLERVPVTREHEHLEVLGGGRGGERGQDIVRLVALARDDRNANSLEDASDVGDLSVELLRGLVPAALVLPVLLGAQGRALEVEGDDQVGGLLLAHELDHGVHESVDALGVDAVGRHETGAPTVLGSAGEREECAERQGVAVDQ